MHLTVIAASVDKISTVFLRLKNECVLISLSCMCPLFHTTWCQPRVLLQLAENVSVVPPVLLMGTIEGEKCSAFHTQLFDHYEYTIWYSQCTACCHNCQCEHTCALKIASLSAEEYKLRHSMSFVYMGGNGGWAEGEKKSKDLMTKIKLSVPAVLPAYLYY